MNKPIDNVLIISGGPSTGRITPYLDRIMYDYYSICVNSAAFLYPSCDAVAAIDCNMQRDIEEKLMVDGVIHPKKTLITGTQTANRVRNDKGKRDLWNLRDIDSENKLPFPCDYTFNAALIFALDIVSPTGCVLIYGHDETEDKDIAGLKGRRSDKRWIKERTTTGLIIKTLKPEGVSIITCQPLERG